MIGLIRTLHLLFYFFPNIGGRKAYSLFKSPSKSGKAHFNKLEKFNPLKEEFKVNGKRVVKYSCGEGPTVLLVHGWHAFASAYHHFVKALIENGYEVVTFDLPAHGNSEGTTSDIEEVVEAIQRIEKDNAPLHCIIGHSLGGMASAYAIFKGLKTQSLILLNTPYSFQYIVDNFSEQLWIYGRMKKYLEQNIENHFPQLKEKIWERFSTNNNLAETNIPILIIHDIDDKMIHIEEGVKLHKQLSSSHLIKTSKLGHNGILRDKDTISNCITYLKEIKYVEVMDTVS